MAVRKGPRGPSFGTERTVYATSFNTAGTTVCLRTGNERVERGWKRTKFSLDSRREQFSPCDPAATAVLLGTTVNAAATEDPLVVRRKESPSSPAAGQFYNDTEVDQCGEDNVVPFPN